MPLSEIHSAAIQALASAGVHGLTLSGIGYALLTAGVVTSQRSHISPQGAALMAGRHVHHLVEVGLVRRLGQTYGYGLTATGRAAAVPS